MKKSVCGSFTLPITSEPTVQRWATASLAAVHPGNLSVLYVCVVSCRAFDLRHVPVNCVPVKRPRPSSSSSSSSSGGSRTRSSRASNRSSHVHTRWSHSKCTILHICWLMIWFLGGISALKKIRWFVQNRREGFLPPSLIETYTRKLRLNSYCRSN